MRKPSWDLNKAIKQYGFTPVELPSDAIYEADKTYWCGYWQKWYKVLSATHERHGKYNHLKNVTVQWQDGHIGTHRTSLDPMRDWELIWPDS